MFQIINDKDKPLTERVSDEIIKLITDSHYKAGDKLPNEYEIADKLKVGRSTVREAIKALVSQNVLEIHRGSGTFVCERLGISDDPLGLRFFHDKKKLGLDLCQIRFMIEPQIAAIAAEKASDADIEEMQRLCDAIASKIRLGEDYKQLDIELHTKIAGCTDNMVMPNLIPIINSAITLFIDITNSALKDETIATHQAVVDAMRRRDPEAARDAMTLHLKNNQYIIKALP